MEFTILGPFEARTQDRVLPLGGPKQRAVLAQLLLNAGDVVSRDRLVAGTWSEPPESADKAVQVHVSQLRKALGPDAPIRTRAPRIRARGRRRSSSTCRASSGSSRRPVPRAIAARTWRLRRRAARGARALARPAARRVRAGAVRARREAARLEELRLAALEERIDADLALGRHARARRRARGARRRGPAPRAPAGPADARALPLRPPGGGARGLPRRAPRCSTRSSASSPGSPCSGWSGRSWCTIPCSSSSRLRARRRPRPRPRRLSPHRPRSSSPARCARPSRSSSATSPARPGLGERLDPEAMRRVIARYFDEMRVRARAPRRHGREVHRRRRHGRLRHAGHARGRRAARAARGGRDARPPGAR